VAVDIVGSESEGEYKFQLYTTIAFVLGAITSTVSGYFGMQIATFTNTKVAYMAQSSLEEGFKVAYRAGCVMGFFLTSLGLLVLTILIAIYRVINLIINLIINIKNKHE
jgi:Na+/H+-translocating membrane pyrophosphatase